MSEDAILRFFGIWDVNVKKVLGNGIVRSDRIGYTVGKSFSLIFTTGIKRMQAKIYQVLLRPANEASVKPSSKGGVQNQLLSFSGLLSHLLETWKYTKITQKNNH